MEKINWGILSTANIKNSHLSLLNETDKSIVYTLDYEIWIERYKEPVLHKSETIILYK